MFVDLHIHSTFSDGTCTPDEILRLAAQKKLAAVSITDHDTMAGLEQIEAAGKKYGIETVPGIELSVECEGVNMHLLGYYLNGKDKNVAEKLEILQKARDDRNRKILERLQRQNINISFSELENFSGEGQTGRPHIARLLVRHGHAENMEDAFVRYLKKGSLAYVDRFVLEATEAVRLVRNAGGLAVMAHPLTIDYSLKKVVEIIDPLIDAGLGGIELYYPTHSRKMKKKIRKLAEEKGLFCTGGSDYHGAMRKGTSIADGTHVCVPYDTVAEMKNRAGITC